MLATLGALDAESNGKITPLGRRILALPVHPRLARLLLAAADDGMLDAGATLAALLSEKDIALIDVGTQFRDRVPRTQGDSDLLVRMEMLQRAEANRFSRSMGDEGIDVNVARQVARTRDQLLRIATSIHTSGTRRTVKPQAATEVDSRNTRQPSLAPSRTDDDALLKLILCAYPDRVCRRRGNDPLAGVMVGGGGVKLARESVVTRAEFFLALDARRDERSASREALVRIASRIELDWIEQLFPQFIRREKNALFDSATGRVVGVSQTFYRDLLLREDRNASVDPKKRRKRCSLQFDQKHAS